MMLVSGFRSRTTSICVLSSGQWRRAFANKSEKKQWPEEYADVLEGRGRHERDDSITLTILEERKRHQERYNAILNNTDTYQLAARLEDRGFGSKTRIKGVYEPFATAAGGFGTHLASVTNNFPVFKHLLPEIAFAGHSNSGKSTLVNALIGVPPRQGPAKVSDRAGWTDSISFYQLGKRPPIVTLVDFPGFGHAVASKQEKDMWQHMISAYLSDRVILTQCVLLVDSTRGLCAQDTKFLKTLNRYKVPWTIVATKGDLLTCTELAAALLIIEEDLQPLLARHPLSSASFSSVSTALASDETPTSSTLPNALFNSFPSSSTARGGAVSAAEVLVPVSASTGAGVARLWQRLVRWVDEAAVPITGPASVREHRKANEMRRVATEAQVKKNAQPGNGQFARVKLTNRLLRKLK